jgi:hypothetical protein
LKSPFWDNHGGTDCPISDRAITPLLPAMVERQIASGERSRQLATTFGQLDQNNGKFNGFTEAPRVLLSRTSETFSAKLKKISETGVAKKAIPDMMGACYAGVVFWCVRSCDAEFS